MGWTCMPRQGRTVKEILKAACMPHKVLDIAIVNRSTAYIACEIPGTGVAALVFLLQYRRDDYDFCYKDMDESMGPCECDCPERILNLLTAEPVGYAKEWRERCWARLRMRRRILSGEKFSLALPLKFSDGVYRQNFVHEKSNKFKCLDTGVIVSIRKTALQNVMFK